MSFRQLVLNKILAPDVFDYGDSKSESWHRAKVFMVNKTPCALFFVIENRVCFGQGRSQTFDRGGGAKGGAIENFLILRKLAKNIRKFSIKFS